MTTVTSWPAGLYRLYVALRAAAYASERADELASCAARDLASLATGYRHRASRAAAVADRVADRYGLADTRRLATGLPSDTLACLAFDILATFRRGGRSLPCLATGGRRPA